MLITQFQTIVPFAIKLVPINRECGQFFVGNLDSQGVGIFIKGRLDVPSFACTCAADQIDNDLPAEQRMPSPIGCDVPEHVTLNLVPGAGSRREVTGQDRQVGFVGPLLQLPAPQTHPVAIAPAIFRRNVQARCLWIHYFTHFAPPAPDALHSDFGNIVVNTDIHPAGWSGHRGCE